MMVVLERQERGIQKCMQAVYIVKNIFMNS